jgi:adenine phosphoribosyltransferase
MELDGQLAALRGAIRDVPDFPKPGIVFKDITTLLRDEVLFRRALDLMSVMCGDLAVDTVVAIESRGFILGGALALRLGAGFVPVRKPGKLPWKARRASYQLEYGSDSLEIHEDALKPGERALVVDDVIATGGTARAVGELVASLGATVVGFAFLVELGFLDGRAKLAGSEIRSLIRY